MLYLVIPLIYRILNNNILYIWIWQGIKKIVQRLPLIRSAVADRVAVRSVVQPLRRKTAGSRHEQTASGILCRHAVAVSKIVYFSVPC